MSQQDEHDQCNGDSCATRVTILATMPITKKKKKKKRKKKRKRKKRKNTAAAAAAAAKLRRNKMNLLLSNIRR